MDEVETAQTECPTRTSPAAAFAKSRCLQKSCQESLGRDQNSKEIPEDLLQRKEIFVDSSEKRT